MGKGKLNFFTFEELQKQFYWEVQRTIQFLNTVESRFVNVSSSSPRMICSIISEEMIFKNRCR